MAGNGTGMGDISIHAPHARSDTTTQYIVLCKLFQSTLLMRGATSALAWSSSSIRYFNPRSSCEERLDSIHICCIFIKHFNPRSSCEERPKKTARPSQSISNFNPRSSCEERRDSFRRYMEKDYFNPRSSCEERHMPVVGTVTLVYFNPRSSCEERRHTLFIEQRNVISIHAPHARSDVRRSKADVGHAISIHAPHARSDIASRILIFARRFQSTLLMRGATSEPPPCASVSQFQSTLLMRGATVCWTLAEQVMALFQSTLLMRGATHYTAIPLDLVQFQSTLLMRGATVSILGIDLPDFIIYFSRTYPFSPKMPTSRHLSCKLHFLCDGTSHFGDL